MRRILIAFLIMTPCLFAYGDGTNCKEVSGGVVTNFQTESGTVKFGNGNGQSFLFTTQGTATGDLAGGIGVYIFSFDKTSTSTGPVAVARVHHHWVTEAGDTIFAQDAPATAYQVGHFAGVYAVADDSYIVNIIGGTGRFAGASGTLKVTGVLDTSQPDPTQWKVVLRYQGTICFASRD